MRYTRKDAESAFGRLCQMLNKRQTDNYHDVGGWTLDYNGVYGGYVVHEVVNPGGGISEPFGPMRRNAREFCESVYFVARALEVINH